MFTHKNQHLSCRERRFLPAKIISSLLSSTWKVKYILTFFIKKVSLATASERISFRNIFVVTRCIISSQPYVIGTPKPYNWYPNSNDWYTNPYNIWTLPVKSELKRIKSIPNSYINTQLVYQYPTRISKMQTCHLEPKIVKSVFMYLPSLYNILLLLVCKPV